MCKQNRLVKNLDLPEDKIKELQGACSKSFTGLVHRKVLVKFLTVWSIRVHAKRNA